MPREQDKRKRPSASQIAKQTKVQNNTLFWGEPPRGDTLAFTKLGPINFEKEFSEIEQTAAVELSNVLGDKKNPGLKK